MRPARRAALVAAVALALASPVPARAALSPRASARTAAGCGDWAAYGRGPAHTSAVPAGCSPIDRSNVATLLPRWFIPTRDSVTAAPTVVGDRLYVGSWDGRFYAVDTTAGKVVWTFDTSATSPTAFGRIVSTATVTGFPDAATGHDRQVVLFGGGSSVWALDAATGHLLAALDLDPRAPQLRAAQQASASPPVVEVESSPVVGSVPVGEDHERRIFVGLDVHNTPHVGRTGVVALRLASSPDGAWRLEPLWKYDAETGAVHVGAAGLTAGSGQGWGCGGVWSSPALDEATGTVTFGTASCSHVPEEQAEGASTGEEIVALDGATGQPRWRFRPLDATKDDADFGASANLFSVGGRPVVGEGRKDARYYVRDLTTGAEVWTAVTGTPGRLQDDFALGGYLGTPAVAPDGRGGSIVVGATAVPIPHSAGEVVTALWSLRAVDGATGRVLWTSALGGPTYGSATVVGGVVLVPDTTGSSVQAFDLATGRLLWLGPVVGPPSSTAVVAGRSVYVGTGTRETDLEFKAVGTQVQQLFAGSVGASPLSPLSGIAAFSLPTLG